LQVANASDLVTGPEQYLFSSTLFVKDLLLPALAIGHARNSYQEAELPSKIAASNQT
jgi:hypothetical protein